MKIGALSVAAAVLAGAAVFAIGAMQIDGSAGYSGLSPRFLPTLVAAGLAGCGALLWLDALRSKSVAAATLDEKADAPIAQRSVRDLSWVVGGLVTHLVTIGSLGFVAASVVLMVCVARGYGSTRPTRDALIAVTLALPVWLIFAKVIGVALPLCPVLGL